MEIIMEEQFLLRWFSPNWYFKEIWLATVSFWLKGRFQSFTALNKVQLLAHINLNSIKMPFSNQIPSKSANRIILIYFLITNQHDFVIREQKTIKINLCQNQLNRDIPITTLLCLIEKRFAPSFLSRFV